jgi:hypothetical protein
MGDEARCTLRFDGQVSEGRAVLETDELVFRGDFRLAIPLRAVRSVAARDGELSVEFPAGTASFELGARAARWAERIRKPKSLLDKLGVKADSRISVLGVRDDTFLREVAERVGNVAVEPAAESDFVFLGAESVDDLRRLEEVRNFLKPNGAIWVVAPKGGREPREADVLAAGPPAGLVDTKVVRFSETHTAHKFVIPVSQR